MTALSPLRADRITGSRIAKLFDVSPYGDRASLMREMVRQHFGYPDEFKGNIATDYGIEHEPQAVAEYEDMYDVALQASGEFQETVIHPDIDYLAVTPDGWVNDDGLVEVKCPWKSSYTHISQRPDYDLQVRLALEVTGRKWADFVVWRPDGISVSRVVHDPWWIDEKLPVLEAFMAEYRAVLADEELAAPHLTPLVDQRTDEEWQLFAVEYLEALAECRRADAVLAELKEYGKKLAGDLKPGTSVKGFGVSIGASERSGGFDKPAAVAAGVNLEQFVKAATVIYTIRQSGSAA